MRSYTVQGVSGSAARAIALACDLLRARGGHVHDVQDDPRFRHRGVDLLWERAAGELLGVEVKGDRQRNARYFFELISNAERETPGCFLYSTADLYLYVFLAIGEAHLLSLPQVRAWFLEHRAEYPLKATQTRVGPSQYTTIGASVPVADVARAVPEAVTVVRNLYAQPVGAS